MKFFTYRPDQKQSVGVLLGALGVNLSWANAWFARETQENLFEPQAMADDLLALVRAGDGARSRLAWLFDWLGKQEQPYPQGVSLDLEHFRLGTPQGVGFSHAPPVVLNPGDEIEVEIENLGTLKNFVL
jgi:hypothetical protein